VINYILIHTAVECFFEDQLHNHMDGVEEAYLHFSFQIHLNTPCSKSEEP
jgi:hypothetical protein